MVGNSELGPIRRGAPGQHATSLSSTNLTIDPLDGALARGPHPGNMDHQSPPRLGPATGAVAQFDSTRGRMSPTYGGGGLSRAASRQSGSRMLVSRGSMGSRAASRTLSPPVPLQLITLPDVRKDRPKQLRDRMATVVEEVETFCRKELATLFPTPESRSSPSAAATKLEVYKEGVKQLLPHIPQCSGFFTKVFQAYDEFIAAVEHGDQSNVGKEKKKIADMWDAHVKNITKQKDAEVEAVRQQLKNVELSTAARLISAEKAVETLHDEASRLKLQQQDDHERVLVLSQSVVDFRYQNQKHEIHIRELEEEIRKGEVLRQKQTDLLADAEKMARELQRRGISFDMRSTLLLEATRKLGESSSLRPSMSTSVGASNRRVSINSTPQPA